MNTESFVLPGIRPALTVVLGDAWSGKSHWAVQNCAAVRGVPLIIAPTTREAELLGRAVTGARNGLSAAVAITFSQLTDDILRSAEVSGTRVLSSSLQRLVLADLVRQHIGADDYFGGMLIAPGFVAALQRGIQEWKRAGATSGLFEAVLQNGAIRIPDNLFRRKLPDLIRIFRAYEQFLASNRYSDSSDNLRAATAHLLSRKTPVPFHASLIVIDGFHQFNPAQIDLIRALAAATESTAGSPKCRVAVTLSCDETRPLLFAAPLRTLQRLRSEFTTEEITLPLGANAESAVNRLSRRLYTNRSLSGAPVGDVPPSAFQRKRTIHLQTIRSSRTRRADTERPQCNHGSGNGCKRVLANSRRLPLSVVRFRDSGEKYIRLFTNSILRFRTLPYPCFGYSHCKVGA